DLSSSAWLRCPVVPRRRVPCQGSPRSRPAVVPCSRKEGAMATVKLIEYAEASAEVRAVYDDIMATRKVDRVNNFWKALASPPTLRRTWETLKSLMAPCAPDALHKEMGYLAEAQARSDAAASQMTWAVHVSLAPIWFDPAEHTGIITVMMVLTAVHDAMVKPMPGNPLAPSLAESWTMSKDGLVYEFVVRKGVVFHNG